VKQRARDLRDEQARHHLRPALQPPQRPPPAGQSMRSSASN
jgi:hypothetical protein